MLLNDSVPREANLFVATVLTASLFSLCISSTAANFFLAIQNYALEQKVIVTIVDIYWILEAVSPLQPVP